MQTPSMPSGGIMTLPASRVLARAAACRTACFAAALLAAAPLAFSQEADIGVAPVTLDGPYLFDTAEQHGIRVDVVARGLAHPFSLAFLPSGDALISERGGALRL